MYCTINKLHLMRSCDCGSDLFYPGLPCSSVRSLLPPSLTAASALNFAGFFLGVWLTAAATAAAQQQRRRRWDDVGVRGDHHTLEKGGKQRQRRLSA